MNILKNTKCYLAGPLEYSSSPYNWRKEITSYLHSINVKVLDPTKITFVGQKNEDDEHRIWLKEKMRNKDFYPVHTFMKEIIRKDLRMIDLLDFAIIRLEIDAPTYGTVHELAMCSLQRKPVFVLIDDVRKIPLWVIGLVDPSCFFESVSDLTNRLSVIDCGKDKLNKYWRLLIPELR